MGLATVLFLANCKNVKKHGYDEVNVDEPIEIDLNKEKEKLVEEVTGYPIPTSIEITEMLNQAGASYIFELGNSTDNVDNYVTQANKALNLGLYGADLSYAVTYRQTQETMHYLKASKKLIDDLNISTSFNDSLQIRVEANLDNPDSLINIISDSFYETYKYLNSNEQNKLSILVITGSWIEGMYITSQIAMTSVENEEFKEIIVNQKSSLKKLLEVMEPVKNEGDVISIYKRINDIKIEYDNIEQKATDAQIEAINSKVTSLRESIVNP